MASGERRIVYGRDCRHAASLETTVSETLNKHKCDFAVVPLVHPQYGSRDLSGQHSLQHLARPLTRSDKILPGADWSTVVVGRLSALIQLDSPVQYVRNNSQAQFHQEVAWAAHLGVPALLLPTPSVQPTNYAMNVLGALPLLQHCQVWVHVPLMAKAAGDVDPWESWNKLRLLCDHNAKLNVALEVTEELPEQVVLDRWISEPVKAVVVSTKTFLTNKNGFPVLSKRHQQFFKALCMITQHVILKGRIEHPNATAEDGSSGLILYRQYLEHLQTQAWSNGNKLIDGYSDYLQFPLQPLADNLESAVYEIFEKDPIKYKLYEDAVYHALMDRRTLGDAKSQKPITLMVVGAGRGPLVMASLRASEKADYPIKVYAVEKNPNAIVTLQNLVLDQWGDKVTVIQSDMRVWNPPSLADILVSELLGSFGDNELSPECLDGAQRLMKPDGISIPYDSTSYIVPVSNVKVYNDCTSFNDLAHMETPFVVKLQGCWLMSEIQPLFVFEHPNHDLNLSGQPDNTRFAVKTFKASANGLLHGIAGYFESKLYKEIQLSILPSTHSPGMFSWFPIFFPLRTAVQVVAGSTIEVAFWRRVSTKKVWYEWSVTVDGRTSPVHNPAGRSYGIGL